MVDPNPPPPSPLLLARRRPPRLANMMPIMIAMVARSFFVTGQNCFGGIETFEKVSMVDYDATITPAGVLLQQPDHALTRDCINLCKSQPTCLSFGLDYVRYKCAAYSVNSLARRSHLVHSNSTNFFEKVCYRGVPRDEYEKVCGIERLWAFERVADAYLDGFERIKLNNVGSRSECAKACLMETQFICRSADYDHAHRVCRLSKEDRRTQPQGFRLAPGSQREYIENQCAAPGPTTCLYETKKDVGVITMDSLVFAHNPEDCQFKCDKEHTFNCRSFSIEDKRCFLSGDDDVSLTGASLPVRFGSLYGEKKCVTERCTNGIFSYEKITGYAIRTAITTPINLKSTGKLGITSECRESCDKSNLNCPAFVINYSSSRCESLDRNTQGKILELVPQNGESIFEKICLRVPEILQSSCRDKLWAFERVIGHELTPVNYHKAYNFVQSRRDCQEYCLHEKEFECKSALYNEETTECKLSPFDRRDVTFNYVRNNNHKISYLENQCVKSHSACPYVETQNAYPTYTDLVEREQVVSVDSCQTYCNDNTKFLCRSFAYYSSNGQCFISGDDTNSAGTTALQTRSGMTYFERKCDIPSTTGRSDNNSTAEHLEPIDDNHDHAMTTSLDHSSHSHTHGGHSHTHSESSEEDMTSHGLVSGRGEGSSIRPEFTDQTEPPELPKPTDHSLPPKSVSNPSLAGGSSFPANVPSSVQGRGHVITLPPAMTTVHTPTSPRPRIKNSRSEETTRAPPPPDPSDLVHPVTRPKCEANSQFTFERVPNFEPVGGYLNLLFSDTNNPGIVPECTKRCTEHGHCLAFIVDYNHGSCHGMFENSSVGQFDLRMSIGKDYFEGFCVPMHLFCPHRMWHFDRIVDQSAIGYSPKSVINYISKKECKIKCLEERRFPCSSASFDNHRLQCKLFDVNRHSGQLQLVFTKGIDYMENLCYFDPEACHFNPYERDVSMIAITKSIRSSSAFVCERECASESSFNCRSFTYVDQSSIPGANLCLLSTDNRRSSQKGATTFRPRALYGERECLANPNYRPPLPNAPREGRNNNGYGSNLNTPYFPSPTGHDVHQTFPGTPSTNHLIPPSMYPSGMEPVELMFSDRHRHDIMSNNLLPPATNLESDEPCGYHQYTFEKTFGYDIRYARKDRSRLPPRLGIAIQCQDECLRRGYRCNAFIIEYGPAQSCFLLQESAAENRKILQKVMDVAYFEKICLKQPTCGKLWTFERLIGHTLEETPDKEIQAVESRADCQDFCLSEKSFSCRSATYDYKNKSCSLFTETRRSRPGSFKITNDDIDYFENQCSKEPPTCQYKDHNDHFFPYVDRLTHAFSLTDCQRQCDGERLFPCRSVSYETFARDCALSSEDTAILGPGSSSASKSLVLQARRHSIFSEKGSCEQITVQCTQQDMILTMNFDTPFTGRVYAKGNPSQCYVLGTGSNQLQFAISLGSKCGTKPEGEKNFANEVVVQQHPIIMTDSDRTIRVMCSFEAVDQTVTLSSPNAEKPGIDVHKKSYLMADDAPSEISSIVDERTKIDPPVTSVVTNTAPPPSVIMRILDKSLKDASVVSIGDELTLQIELKDPSSAFGIFARNLYARSTNGESMFLLDNTGCPTDSTIFPALQLNPRTGALSSIFKAFRFPSTGIVNFEVQVRFCQDKCDPIKCTSFGDTRESYGRRRRRRFAPIEKTASSSSHNMTSDEHFIDVTTIIPETSVSQESIVPSNETAAEPLPTPQSLVDTNSTVTMSSQPYSYPQQNYVTSYQAPSMSNNYQHMQQPSVNYGPPMHNSPHPNMGGYHQPSNHYPQYTSGLPGHQGVYPPPGHPFSSNRWNSGQQSYGSNNYSGSSSVYPQHSGSGQWTRPHDTSYPSSGFNTHQQPPYIILPPPETTQATIQSSGAPMSGASSPPMIVHSTRPLPSSEKGKFRPPRPLPRPKSPATSSSGETLSTTIMVGDKDDTSSKSGGSIGKSWSIERRPTKYSGSCNSGPAILYTAIVVTLLHCGVLLGGYFYYRLHTPRITYHNHSQQPDVLFSRFTKGNDYKSAASLF